MLNLLLNINISPQALISISREALCLYFAFQILAFKHYKIGSKKVLFWYLISLFLVEAVLITTQLNLQYYGKYLLPFFASGILIIAPLMYIYVLSLSYIQKKYNLFLHFIPAIFSFIVLHILFILLYILDKNTPEIITISIIFKYFVLINIVGLFTIQNILYIILSIIVYKKHKKIEQSLLSFDAGINLRWLYLYLIGYIAFILGVYLAEFFNRDLGEIIANLVMFIYILFLGYNGLKQFDKYIYLVNTKLDLNLKSEADLVLTKKIEEIENNEAKIISNENIDKVSEVITNEINNNIINNNENLKEELQIIISERNEDIYKRVVDILKNKKLFLNKEFTIFDLAKELQINYKYISQAINQGLNKNFVTFINEYRIETAKEMLVSPDYSKYTIEAISEKAGFNSKSSFNNYFKKIIGQTPSEFRENIKI